MDSHREESFSEKKVRSDKVMDESRSVARAKLFFYGNYKKIINVSNWLEMRSQRFRLE
jgi:hypothetical protein